MSVFVFHYLSLIFAQLIKYDVVPLPPLPYRNAGTFLSSLKLSQFWNVPVRPSLLWVSGRVVGGVCCVVFLGGEGACNSTFLLMILCVCVCV